MARTAPLDQARPQRCRLRPGSCADGHGMPSRVSSSAMAKMPAPARSRAKIRCNTAAADPSMAGQLAGERGDARNVRLAYRTRDNHALTSYFAYRALPQRSRFLAQAMLAAFRARLGTGYANAAPDTPSSAASPAPRGPSSPAPTSSPSASTGALTHPSCARPASPPTPPSPAGTNRQLHFEFA